MWYDRYIQANARLERLDRIVRGLYWAGFAFCIAYMFVLWLMYVR